MSGCSGRRPRAVRRSTNHPADEVSIMNLPPSFDDLVGHTIPWRAVWDLAQLVPTTHPAVFSCKPGQAMAKEPDKVCRVW
jgi:hypothetical protein